MKNNEIPFNVLSINGSSFNNLNSLPKRRGVRVIKKSFEGLRQEGDILFINKNYFLKVDLSKNEDNVWDELVNRLKRFVFVPSDELIEAFNLDCIDMEDLVKIIFNMNLEGFFPFDLESSHDKGLNTRYLHYCISWLVQHIKIYIDDMNIVITNHAISRFVTRNGGEINLINNTDDSVEIPEGFLRAMGSFVTYNVFRFFMLGLIKEVLKFGKDPYKFKKVSKDLAAYFEDIKKRHGKGHVVKICGKCVWIFKRDGAKLILLTYYPVKDCFKDLVDDGYSIPTYGQVLSRFFEFFNFSDSDNSMILYILYKNSYIEFAKFAFDPSALL